MSSLCLPSFKIIVIVSKDIFISFKNVDFLKYLSCKGASGSIKDFQTPLTPALHWSQMSTNYECPLPENFNGPSRSLRFTALCRGLEFWMLCVFTIGLRRISNPQITWIRLAFEVRTVYSAVVLCKRNVLHPLRVLFRFRLWVLIRPQLLSILQFCFLLFLQRVWLLQILFFFLKLSILLQLLFLSFKCVEKRYPQSHPSSSCVLEDI